MVIPAAQTGLEKLREPHNKLHKGKRTYHSICTLSPLSSWVTLLPELLAQIFKPFQPDTTSMLPGTEIKPLAPEKQPYLAEAACLVWGRKVSRHITLSNSTEWVFDPISQICLHLPALSSDVSIPCINRATSFSLKSEMASHKLQVGLLGSAAFFWTGLLAGHVTITREWSDFSRGLKTMAFAEN